MANLKEIRSRIVSVNSTKQITSAMKMVSAAKLHKAQAAILRMRPYAQKMQDILRNLSGSLDVSENEYGQEREPNRILIVAINSNRGLCGGFNNNIHRKVNELISMHSNAKVKVLGVGKKAFDKYKKTPHATGAGYPEEPYQIFNEMSFEAASLMAESIMDKFVEKKLDKVYLVYNSFKNAGVQLAQVENFLPIQAPEPQDEGATAANQTEFIFEPSKEEIVTQLIPLSLKTQFYKALRDSVAAEHGARMTAMHQATDNATELVKQLNLTYNKARQASITNEILEIVSGAEALSG